MERDRIDRGAMVAINEVVELLERHETLSKIRSHQEAKYLFLEPENGEEGMGFPPDDSLIQYVAQKKISRDGDQVELSVVEESGGQIAEQNISFDIDELPYGQNFEDELRVQLMTADSIELETNPDADQNDNLDDLKERLQTKRAFLGDIVKSLIEVNLNQSIEERIDPRILDSLIRVALKRQGLDLSYNFGIYDRSGKMVLGMDENRKALDSSTKRARLFPNDVVQTPFFLRLDFPNEDQYILNSLWWLLLVSLVFLVALVWTSFTSIHTIFRQKQNSEIKNDFINNMTHELKTPISTISLACEALNDPELGKIESVKNRYLGIINAENKRLGLLVEEVLQSAVLDKGDFKLKREDLDIHQILKDVIDKFQIQLKEKGGIIKLNEAADRSFIEGDKNHITNVFYNLLDNAAKYSKQEPLIEVNTSIENDRIRISVRDRGIGISPDNLKKIFDRLYRVPTGNLHNVKGFGLGLSYVKIIAERHGGCVSVESELGKGSTFYIELPLKNPNHGNIKAA